MPVGGSVQAQCATCRAPLRAGAVFCAQCGTAVEGPARDPLIGTVLAHKFRVRAVLGEGGMGKVYKAEQVPLGIDVVIKVLHPQLAGDTMIVKRFFREAQAASQLRHPNCVGVLDFGDSDGTLYIAMEYLRGRTLAKLLEEAGRLDARRAVRVISQVLDVLEAAHRMNIVHRDLKPENIMLEDLPTQRDFVKVLDFGIAKIVERDGATKLTQTGLIFGTPQYMAPEQANGDEVDARADLYSIGAVLFELLTGRVPFVGGSLAMLLADVVTKPAPPVASLAPEVPPRLAALVDQALAKAPADRPQRALDFKLALEAALAEPAPRAERAEATRPCPSCGQPMPAGAKFCGECGASTALAQATGVHDKFADLRRFLPTGVVDELAQVKPRAAGQRREIVALVVDVGGSALEGEQAEHLTGELYEGLASLAVRRGGALERRPGAGAVVTFGLSALHADDAERAVAAALEARALVEQLRERERVELEATCAIHGGVAVVEHDDRGPSYTAVGDTVELPARLAAAVAAGKIVVSERIRAALGDQVALRPMEGVRLKGRAAAVPVYEVAALRARGEQAAGLARPPTAGRDALLEAILGTAGDGKRGRAIHITGEPGSGKTRLLDELAARWAAPRRIAIALAPHGRGSRIEPAIARLGDALGGSADALRALGMAGGDVRLLVRYLGGGAGPDGLGEAEERMALVAALRTGLEALAARAPVALLVDDAHLAEPLTSMLLARGVAEPIPGVLLVTTSRPGYPAPWDAARAAAAGLQAITLPMLDDDAIAELVAGALAPTPPPPELAAAVIARAGGSPLMALEVLRALVDRGVLASLGGRWTVTGDLASVPRPDGVRALVAARIDALPPRAREVLACIAVYAGEVPEDVLRRYGARALSGPGGADSLDRIVELLVARGLIARGAVALGFAEPSARETMLERLPRDERAKLHLAIASTLEAMPEPRPVPDEAVGEHFAAAGEADKALFWLDRAATAALRDRQRPRAAAILKQARELVRAVAPGERTAGRNRRLADDSLRLGELLLELGELEPLRTIASEGLACAHADDDPELIARMRRLRGRTLLATGDARGAIAELDAALTGALGVRGRVLIAELHGDLGEAHEKAGDLAKALEYMTSALELAQGTASQDVRRLALRLLTAIGRVCVRNRELDRAQRFLQQGLELAQELDDQLGAVKVLGNLAGVYHARGDHSTAIRFVRRALDLARELGDQVGVTRQLTNLGTLYAALGDRASAASNYEAAIAAAQRCGWREGMAAAAAAKDKLSSARTPAR